MTADLYLSVQYWLIFLLVLGFACLLINAKLFDFKFMVVLIMAQYVAHTACSFGQRDLSIALFAAAFALVFVCTYRLNIRVLPLTEFHFYRSNIDAFERTWMWQNSTC